MLTISPHQLAALREPGIQAAIDANAAAVAAANPRTAGTMPYPQLRQGVERCVRIAIDHGISHDGDVADYVALAWRAGIDMHREPWAEPILTSTVSGAAKVGLLEESFARQQRRRRA